MLGIVFLILSVLFGMVLTESFLSCKMERPEMVCSRLWLILPSSFGVGVLLLTWSVYLLAWLFHNIGSDNPLMLANGIVMTAAAIGLFVFFRKKGKIVNKEQLIVNKTVFVKEAVFFTILLIFISVTMFYVFHVKDDVLYSGFTVYGDYAPHTAMMRSFSKGNNYPTQYPHFGGEDVKYHFMFQFFTGNLEYLGLRIDFAYNIPSILSLVGFLMMLYLLARRIVGGFAAGVIAVVLFFFRSALTFFRFVWEHFQAGDLWRTLAENSTFIGYTTNENWGLWNYNVYLNQRHLAFGLLLVSSILWVYLDWVDAAHNHSEKGFRWFRDRLFTWEAWKSRSLETALAAGLILGLCSFWNGAAVIGGLLILLGFAVFSDGKIDYALTAAITILFSLLQSNVFMNGSSMSIAFQWGFLSENKSLPGVLWYLLQMSGIFILGAVFFLFIYKRKERMIAAAFLFPVIFAFTMSLTPDIAVNHKYIMIAYAFLTIFWADIIVKLWKKNHVLKVVAAVLLLCLTITGIYDFVIILRNNGNGRRLGVNLESELTDWMVENLDEKDLILTAQYSMNEVTMSGKMLYSGWPYYAWSAGYDTYFRAAQAVAIFTSSDPATVQNLVEQEEITHIIFEDGIEYEQRECREDVIQELYPIVYQSEDGRIRIYETE